MPNAKPAIAPRARPARRSFARAGRLTIAAGPGAGTTTSPAWWKRRLSTPPGWNACRTAFRTARPRRPYERSAIWTSPNFRRSFRRAASAGIDHPSLTLTHVMHRDLPRPSLRATPKALRYGRGSLLCMTWISSRPPPMRGHDWTRKGGRNWKRFDKQGIVTLDKSSLLVGVQLGRHRFRLAMLHLQPMQQCDQAGSALIGDAAFRLDPGADLTGCPRQRLGDPTLQLVLLRIAQAARAAVMAKARQAFDAL